MGVFSSFHWRSTTPIKCKLWSTSLWRVTSWAWDKTWCSWGQGGLMFPAPRIGINRPQIQSEQSNSWMTYRLPTNFGRWLPNCQSGKYTNHHKWFLVASLATDGQQSNPSYALGAGLCRSAGSALTSRGIFSGWGEDWLSPTCAKKHWKFGWDAQKNTCKPGIIQLKWIDTGSDHDFF